MACAARGGLRGSRYPWGDTLHAGLANYAGSGDPFETGPPPHTTPVGYYNGSQIPAGADTANGYGLYDMAGNLWEWCWDWRDDRYYRGATARDNPRGPASGTHRILRGGCWNDPPEILHVAFRGDYTPTNFDHLIGLRCVRRSGQRAETTPSSTGMTTSFLPPADASKSSTPAKPAQENPRHLTLPTADPLRE